MIFGKKKRGKRHKHQYKIVAINPDEIPFLPELSKFENMKHWRGGHKDTYYGCSICHRLVEEGSNYDGTFFLSKNLEYVEARQKVLKIDEILNATPQKVFNGLSKEEYSGVFTQDELNKVFVLLKQYLLMSRKFYMRHVGKWHPGRNTVRMVKEWGSDYVVCSYCTSSYKGSSCPKCGAGRSD